MVYNKRTLATFYLDGGRAFLNVLLITHQSPLLIIRFIIIPVAFAQCTIRWLKGLLRNSNVDPTERAFTSEAH